ncbi:hypothetical protein ABTL65_19700, partial [Acinetobacter baumannii]
KAAREAWASKLTADLERLSVTRDEDLTLSALDRSNAELRRKFLQLHATVEEDSGPSGVARQRLCLELLHEHARARDLRLPG